MFVDPTYQYRTKTAYRVTGKKPPSEEMQFKRELPYSMLSGQVQKRIGNKPFTISDLEYKIRLSGMSRADYEDIVEEGVKQDISPSCRRENFNRTSRRNSLEKQKPQPWQISSRAALWI